MRLLFGCLVFLGAGLVGAGEPTSGDAPSLYEAACESAVDGDARRRLLKRAIKVDPDYAPARAELGHVLIDGRWRPAGYAAKMAAYDPRQAEYAERLSDSRDTLKDHRRLAKWSEAEGLGPETRVHWLSVLRISPNQDEALNGLNAEWRGGELWDRELAAEKDKQAEATARSAQQWEKRFVRYEKRPTEERLVEIHDDMDSSVIGPIERRVMREPLSEGARDLVSAFLDTGADLPEPGVTASFCRIALAARDEAIRQKAREALATRPRNDAMPLLLSALVAPIESESRVQRVGEVIRYEHRLTRRGSEGDRVHHAVAESTPLVQSEAGLSRWDGRQNLNLNLSEQLGALLQAELRKAEYEFRARENESRLAAWNRAIHASNSLVFEALRSVSDAPLGDEPIAWWTHWQRETGYDIYARTEQRTYDFQDDSYTVAGPPPRPRHECFIAGTPVWTRTGRKAIETLEPGELVLARDPQRGGLVYRAVLDTTVRQPSPTYEITAGGERIVSTEGHPFWVIGRGWRMAKELRDGDVLSTIAGPTPIESIEEAKPARAYNLIVEGAANYYVGETGVLVHDNTPRLPAVGLIAGR